MNLRCPKCGLTHISDDDMVFCPDCHLLMTVDLPDYDASAKYPDPMSHGLSKFKDEI